MATYPGTCFCGTVKIEVSGDPQAMGYCHCESCRSWSASPVNAFSLWKPEQVRVLSGGDQIGTYAKTEKSHRKFCRNCGGHVMTDHPTFGLVDVFAATIPTFPYAPKLHIYYGEKALAVRDGLPKFRDLPEGFGGSGETVAE